MTDTRGKLAAAAILHVPFDGMNEAALRAGACDIGLLPDAALAFFPQGGVDLAAWIHRQGDASLADWIVSAPSGRISERIADAVWKRLEIADRELVRAASVIMALPQNQPLGARLIWETADTIWKGLDDKSEDINWYTKRAVLAAVYAASVLYWLGDQSEGGIETREFIDRRIEDVMQFEKFKASIRKIPGVSALTGLVTEWVRMPNPSTVEKPL